MRNIDAAREWMDVRVPVGFVLVKAHTPGKYDIGHSEQLLFERPELGRGTFEIRKLVHAVVYDCHGLQMARELERHRRVVPGDEAAADALTHERVEHTPQLRRRF